MKWEYEFYPVAPDRDWASVMEALNEKGNDGWQVATFFEQGNARGFLLKRSVSREGNVR
jgi:hypothetical protein